ncbi:protoporphyrinogen oxidase [Halteromyces radiatus]|uniref:protoporphyrinogen oxidase n=1 Tax=Halteromyces radiatus TaxID=101107 RepID=UPI002220E1FA|nr:protoporphyrinogen oxidase [Halteromyces radiatus]KAI8099313.1 protoporphyrinogen oxidase [Halteromyces radiatus]
MMPPVVTILGGGISGLSAAYYLARLAPQIHIRLLEATDHVGGWIKSEKVNDKVLFEAGPRTLRPKGTGGAILLDMLKDLHLDQHIVSVPKKHPSAQHRYIEYKGQINQLPSGLSDLLFNSPPIMDSVMGAIMKEPFQPCPNHVTDESLYDFIQRRFNSQVALNLIGALAHGVYAGDCKQLSVQSTFPLLAACEQKYGSVVKGMMRGGVSLDTTKELALAAQCEARYPIWQHEMQNASVIGLQPGLAALPLALRRFLMDQPNVDLLTRQPVTLLESSSSSSSSLITTQSGEKYESHHVISALPSHILASILPPSSSLPHLTHNPRVDVAVVNLAYKKDDANTQLDGFGFLTPHRDTGSRVPGVLGVIFDSNSMGIQDKDMVRFTAMIGGSDWDLAFGNLKEEKEVATQALALAQQAMSTCLGVDASPTYHQAHVLRQCLPQYLVGHSKRMQELHLALQQRMCLSVTGASYLGVSVPDCVKHSRLLVEDLLEIGALGNQSSVVTGLEKTMISPW